MKICDSSSSISLFVYITLLLISKPTGVVPNPISNKIFSPSTSIPAPQMKYDVFVSFRGSDIRKKFLSHVLEALLRKKIAVYSDKKLRGGDDISELHREIEKSLISLVIFSPNFASSHWCSDEHSRVQSKIWQNSVASFLPSISLRCTPSKWVLIEMLLLNMKKSII